MTNAKLCTTISITKILLIFKYNERKFEKLKNIGNKKVLCKKVLLKKKLLYKKKSHRKLNPKKNKLAPTKEE
jgi:hypothetical protein